MNNLNHGPSRFAWSVRRSVLAPYFSFNLILVIVALIILAAAAIGINRNAIENHVKAHMESIAVIKEREIKSWVSQLTHTVQWVAGEPDFRAAAVTLLQGQVTAPERQGTHDFVVSELKRITALSDAAEFALLDLSGDIFAATNPTWEGQNRGTQQYFINGRSGTSVSEIFQSALMGEPTIAVSTPLFDETGKIAAVLAVFADMDALTDIMATRTGLGATGETFLINSAQVLVTERVNEPGGVFTAVITGDGARRGAAGESGVTLFIDYRGEPVIGAYRWLPDYKLALIAKIDQVEAFQPIAGLTLAIASVAGGLLLLLLAGGWWSARQTARSINGLASYADRVRLGDFTAPVTIQGENEVAYVTTVIKSMVDQLLETQRELADLYNGAPCGYHSLDADGIFVRINDTELRWLGYRREEIVGAKKFSDLLTPTSIETFKSNYPAFKERGEIHDLEFDMVRKNGSIIPVLLSATAVSDAQDRYLYSRSTVVDFTEKKLAQADLEKVNKSLIAANTELEAFSYSVSHDLRAPLRSIDGFSQALIEDYQEKLDDTGQDYLNRVRAATQRMGHLIDDMLSLSRVTRSEFNRGIVDLSTMAYDIVKELNATEPERKVTFSITPDMVTSGDRRLIEALLHNLLENAWKFTRKSANPHIDFGHISLDGENVFFVKDNGVGFEMKFADKLFNPFQRLHNVADFPGTGIGLAIARRIVTRHSGRIWAESGPGAGATFYFTLEKGGHVGKQISPVAG